MREKGRERRSGGGRGQELPYETKKHSKFNPDFSGYHHNKQITTFFVTNFPDDVTTDDLWTTFAKYWKVGEVYIPAKRDKFDRRFGFARFVEVRDVQDLLDRIEGTWFGTYKLRANLSRFNRGEVQHRGDTNHNGKVESRSGGKLSGLNQGLSFKGALGVGAGLDNKSKEVEKSVPEVDNLQGLIVPQQGTGSTGVIHVEPIQTALGRLKHSFVGILREGISVDNIQLVIAMEGFQDVKSTLLGFDKVLLSSSLEDGVLNALEADRAWWSSKFLELIKWSPDHKATGRRIWVRIFGIPPHAWGWDCFNNILNRFGRLVCLDACTENQSRLDVARAQVVVPSWDFVDGTVEILVGKEQFVIRVVEERFGDIDLGVKMGLDPQFFSVGSVAGGGKGGDEECREWNEGWSAQGSDELPVVGPYPAVLGFTGSDMLEIRSDEVTDKVQLVVELEETEQQTSLRKGVDFGEKELNCLEGNPFLALTWIDGDDLGEDLDKRGEVLLSAQEEGGGLLENEDRVSRGDREIGNEVDLDFISNLEEVGPVNNWAGLATSELGCVKYHNNLKNKGILEGSGEVAMDCRELFKGGCSSKILGPDGPSQVLLIENNWVKVLKDKEVAQLKYKYEEEIFATKTLVSGQRILSRAKKTKKHDGNPISVANDLVSGMMKAGRFARAIKQYAGGRKGKKGKKKGNKGHTKVTTAESNDSISDESVHMETLQRNGCRKLVPVAALEVVLTEGESILVNDDAYRNYRIEAERLFNI
ncbi:RNA recognition motif, partial [Trifolium medium]|nr:RNA recognition motif [Trifolium medium]